MHLHHTEAPWPFISKVGPVGYSQVSYNNVRLYETNEVLLDQCNTKNVASGVNCLYSSLLRLWKCICITQKKPHDHLYKKSGQWGYSQVLYKNVRIYDNNEVLLDQWHHIRCQWGKLFIFFSFMFMTMHLQHQEAPWPFISKVGAVGYSQVLYKTVRIYETNEELLDQWHQIRCQWGKFFIFFSFMFMTMNLHHTEVPWPFI